MILAIVGSIRLAGNPLAIKVIKEVLDKYKPDRVVSGGAVGVDTMAREAAKARGIPVDEKLPKNNRWAPHGFAERNLEIAKACTALVRIPIVGSKTYGSGWTRDRAVAMGKPTEEFLIDAVQNTVTHSYS